MEENNTHIINTSDCNTEITVHESYCPNTGNTVPVPFCSNTGNTYTSSYSDSLITTIRTLQEENQMAIEDLLSDIRREGVEHTNEIVKEGIKGDYATQKTINDVERAQSNQIDMVEDVMNNNFMTVARDTADIRAQVISAQQAMVTGFLGAAKDAEINALKTQLTVVADGDKTRELINELKYHDLNRALVERNAELVDERWGRRHWRGVADQGQWAALQNQVQAFQSQLQETRQGMVNFGTMAGVGQSSTSNNVR